MKRRNPQALAAWSRHGGAHDPGTRRPTQGFSVDEYYNEVYARQSFAKLGVIPCDECLNAPALVVLGDSDKLCATCYLEVKP